MDAPRFFIGNIPIMGDVVLAPMAGFCDSPFRRLCRDMGSAYSVTELLSVDGIVLGNADTWRLLKFTPEERPLIYQLFGDKPELFAQAAQRLMEFQPDAFDINLGCSVTKVFGRGAGAALLQDPRKIGRIVELLVRSVPVPITAKIRLGIDARTRNYREVVRVLQESGAALVTVHGRTRVQRYDEPADWDAIAEVKQLARIPVVGNGDVQSVADIARMQRYTGCDAVMIGRAAIGNPWIFARRDWHTVPLEERYQVVMRHFEDMLAFHGEKWGLIQFRKHVVRYLRGVTGAAQARRELVTCTDVDTFRRLLREIMLGAAPSA